MSRFAAIVTLILCSNAVAGPLNPPSGPIASTPGPEPRIAINATNTPGDADSVFRITQPGSYYLTANLTGVSDRAGIEVIAAAGSVTIDLCGFSLIGVAGALDGINTLSGSVEVTNGAVSNWPGNGVEALRASHLRVSSNAGVGILCSDFAMVTDCQVISNGSAGSYGIETGSQPIITDCLVRSNGAAIGGGGISAGQSALILRCVINGNAPCTGSAFGYGLIVSSDSTIADCRLNGNGGPSTNSSGMFAAVGTTVKRCELYNNANIGIQVGGECSVTDNTVGGTGGNPGVGILTTGSRCRIEANHVFNCTVGIRGTAGVANNVIVRNSVRGSAPQYDIPVNNDIGPIGAAATAASPWANLQGP